MIPLRRERGESPELPLLKRETDCMHTESDVSPSTRLWRRAECTNPPLPQWIEDLWVQRGRPLVKGSEAFAPEGRALLWFVGNWYSIRVPYRFGLPEELLEWLNATDLDLTAQVQRSPGLHGSQPCGRFKPLTRFMRSVWERGGRVPSLENVDGYYDFLAEFVFAALPASNAPAALLPREIVDLLNAPAANDDLPLTVGMLLYIKRTCPIEYRKLREHGRDRILALSFHAVEGLLAIGDPRLIPATVSGFWSQRSLSPGVVTAFEYVAAMATNGSVQPGQSDEKVIRNWFRGHTAEQNPRALLFSGPPGDLPSAAGPEMQIQDRAILIYRDHVTTAGLSKAGASMGVALPGTGLPVFDLHFSLRRERLDAEAERNRNLWINSRRKLHILNLNPEYVPECSYCNLGMMGPRDYIVGQFAWELSVLSKAHEPGIAMVDEVWTGSRFLTRLYETSTKKPVVTMGQVISGRQVKPLKPEQFGFSESTFIFLCSFDASSVVERKNPLGAIAAFRNAFPRGTERAGLIIKTRNLEHLQTERDRAHWASALARIRSDSRIRVVDHTMTEDDLAGLYNTCGCFVSLHRSEGFGFGPAEAMAQGRPVIVTNYSGVCDFCTSETAELVGYRLIRVKEDEYPFLDPDRVYEWADPDLNAAAESMRRLAEDREHGERLGCAARALMLRDYSVEAVRSRYLARLEQLGFGMSADSGA
jgi:glycosyltransferase involved in cell wall biosynthesis